MNCSRKLVKELLIKKRQGILAVEPTPIESIPLSPLVTNFERWSDKRRKLYFEDDKTMLDEGLQDFKLENNVFASMLASPMRCERLTRQRVPKDLLIQLKLQKLPDVQGAKHSLKLVPTALHQKGNKSSYLLNSGKIIKKNAKLSPSWIPIPALLSGMRYFKVSDVFIDRDNFLEEYSKETQEYLESELNKVKNYETVLRNWSIVVAYDEGNTNSIELLSMGALEILKLNLGCLGCASPLRQIVEFKSNHDLGFVLELPRDEKIVKLLYRLLACFSSSR